MFNNFTSSIRSWQQSAAFNTRACMFLIICFNFTSTLLLREKRYTIFEVEASNVDVLLHRLYINLCLSTILTLLPYVELVSLKSVFNISISLNMSHIWFISTNFGTDILNRADMPLSNGHIDKAHKARHFINFTSLVKYKLVNSKSTCSLMNKLRN